MTAAKKLHLARYRVCDKPPRYECWCSQRFDAFGAPITLQEDLVTCEECLKRRELALRRTLEEPS